MVQERDNGGWDQGEGSGGDTEKLVYGTVLRNNLQDSVNS